jgi:flagellar biogenesis protein FliO
MRPAGVDPRSSSVARRAPLYAALVATALVLAPGLEPSAAATARAGAAERKPAPTAPARPAAAEPEPARPVSAAAPEPAPAPAAAPDAAPLPAPTPADVLPVGGAKLMIGAVILIALVIGAGLLARRLPVGRFMPGTQGLIRVTAKTHLGPRERLCLVEVGPTAVLIGVTQQGMQTLHVWPQGVAAARSTPPPPAGGERTVYPTGVEVPGQLRGLSARLAATRVG